MADIPNVQQNSLMSLVPWTTGTLPYIVKHAFHFIGKPDKGQNKGQKGFIVANLILAESVWGVWTSSPVRATRPLKFLNLCLIGLFYSIADRAVNPQNDNNFSLDDDVGIRESHSNMAGCFQISKHFFWGEMIPPKNVWVPFVKEEPHKICWSYKCIVICGILQFFPLGKKKQLKNPIFESITTFFCQRAKIVWLICLPIPG